jgi:hypothetical protein
MKKLLKNDWIKSLPLILLMTFIGSSCNNVGSNAYVTPPLFSYSTYAYGQGTDYYSGAVTFQINPISSGYYYFSISINSIGSYNLSGNSLFVPYILPGNYPFTIDLYNSYGNYVNSIYGSFNIYQQTTTQVIARP